MSFILFAPVYIRYVQKPTEQLLLLREVPTLNVCITRTSRTLPTLCFVSFHTALHPVSSTQRPADYL